MSAEQAAPWVSGELIANGIRLHYVESGEGPLVLLLHGFPEFWYSWRYQIPALAAAGFRVIAPDMRGYNLSEKPSGIDAYSIDALVADTAALIQTFDGERGAFLVGHDWGGLVAWYTAHRHPELVNKLIILNAPHPNRYIEVLRGSIAQNLRSWYVGFFQIPWLPERLLTVGGAALVEWAIRWSGADPRHFSPSDARRYREAFGRPGAATATLNYYRAMVRRTLARGGREEPVRVSAPTLLLWGIDDVALDRANAEREALLRWVPDLRVEYFPTSHWIHTDCPDEISARMVSFLREPAQPIFS